MEQVLQVDVATVTFILGSLVPLAVGLIFKKYASSAVKTVGNVVLSVAAGVLAVIVQAKGSITVGQLLTGVYQVLLTGNILHLAVFKPLGITEKVQNLAPQAGIGSVAGTPEYPPTGDIPAPTGTFTVLGDAVDPVPLGLEGVAEAPIASNHRDTAPVKSLSKPVGKKP